MGVNVGVLPLWPSTHRVQSPPLHTTWGLQVHSAHTPQEKGTKVSYGQPHPRGLCFFMPPPLIFPSSVSGGGLCCFKLSHQCALPEGMRSGVCLYLGLQGRYHSSVDSLYKYRGVSHTKCIYNCRVMGILEEAMF